MSLNAQTGLVVQERAGNVILFSIANPSHRTTIPVGAKPHEIELTPDGRTAFVSNFGLLEVNHKEGSAGTTISVIDVVTRRERTRYSLPSDFTAPHGLKLRPNQFRELFTNAEDGKEGMVVFNAASGAVLRTFPLPSGIHNFVFNSEGSALFAFAVNGTVYRIDPDSGNVLAHVQLSSPRGLAWSADNGSLIASGKNEIVMLDPAHLSIVKRIGNLGVGQIFYPTATPDGHWILAPAVLDSVLLILDASTGAVARRIETGSPLLTVIGPRRTEAWVSNVLVPAGMFGPATKPRDGGVAHLDLNTFEVTPIPNLPDANGIAISAQP